MPSLTDPQIVSAIIGALIPTTGFLSYNLLKKKIRKKQLLNILLDMSRHFWRNAVVLKTVRNMILLPENSDKKPSEIHFIKLKNLDPGSSIFFDSHTLAAMPGKYLSKFHKLQLNIRNFDIEAGIASKYINKPEYTKEGMLEYVDFLLYKMSFLTLEVEDIVKMITKSQKDIENMYNYMTDGRINKQTPLTLFYESERFKTVFDEDVSIESNSNRILFLS